MCYTYVVVPNAHRHCPAGHALALLGDRWSLMIVREALRGVERFDGFRQALGMSDHTLSRRLMQLREVGIVVRTDDGSYMLTAAGRDLARVLAVLGSWGSRWLEVDAPLLPPPPAVVAAAAELGLRVRPRRANR